MPPAPPNKSITLIRSLRAWSFSFTDGRETCAAPEARVAAGGANGVRKIAGHGLVIHAGFSSAVSTGFPIHFMRTANRAGL